MVILAFGLLPSFRSVRLLNIIALCGTNYSCLYFFIYAAKHGIRPGAFTRCTAATPALVTCPECSHCLNVQIKEIKVVEPQCQTMPQHCTTLGMCHQICGMPCRMHPLKRLWQIWHFQPLQHFTWYTETCAIVTRSPAA